MLPPKVVSRAVWNEELHSQLRAPGQFEDTCRGRVQQGRI